VIRRRARVPRDQARADDASTSSALDFDHADADGAARGRSVMRRLGGETPSARRVRGVEDGTIRMVAGVFTPDGAREARTAVEAGDPEEAADLAEADLRAEGAEEILAAVRP
jgi:porphobilinogen deaminase